MPRTTSFKSLAAATALLGLTSTTTASDTTQVPCISVPACPDTRSIQYSKSVPYQAAFPETQVDLCYTDTTISLGFTARGEESFFYNATQGTNDDIWAYEVMEAFIHRGTDDPATYLEFEINPGNATYQAFVYNPSKVRAAGAPFDHFFIDSPRVDGFAAETELDRAAGVWRSQVEIPFALWNVDEGQGKGTKWRMNFFRTTTSEETFPAQGLGAWSPPDEANFHITKFLGHVTFV